MRFTFISSIRNFSFFFSAFRYQQKKFTKRAQRSQRKKEKKLPQIHRLKKEKKFLTQSAQRIAQRFTEK